MSNQFAVIGDGAWGTAIAILLAKHRGHRVTLWSARQDNACILQERRENIRLLPGVPIPPEIRLATDPRAAVSDADAWIIAVPTVYLRDTLQRFVAVPPDNRPVLSLTKGLEHRTFQRPTQVIAEILGAGRLAVLSGPSHAEEVSREMPASMVAASSDFGLARWVQESFSTERFRVYTNLDIVGVELGGALKNVIGIAAGIGDGLGLGDNAKAALLTRGLAEIARFGVALGAEHQTFYGLAGLGDLVTTCISRHGRNRLLGERLGRGEMLDTIVAGMAMVVEGVNTTRSVYEKATLMGVEMPITTEIYRVLYEGKPPALAVRDLMVRQPTSEHGV